MCVCVHIFIHSVTYERVIQNIKNHKVTLKKKNVFIHFHFLTFSYKVNLHMKLLCYL